MPSKKSSAVKTPSDGLPFYTFRNDKQLPWNVFLKSFSKALRLKKVLRPLSPNILADLFVIIERLDMKVAAVLMNAVTYSDIRKWGRDVLDIETQSNNLKKGLMGRIWGAEIIVNAKIPDGIVLATSEEIFSTCAILELGQEEFYNLSGLGALKSKAAELHRSLNSVYGQMEKIIDRALEKMENKR